jgi:hypothetical protein
MSDFHAQSTMRERMFGIAFDADSAAIVVNVHEH